MVRVALIFLLLLLSSSSFGAGFGGVSVRAPAGVKVSGTDGIFSDLLARDTSIHLRGSHRVNLDFQNLMKRDVSILSGRAISPSAIARAVAPYVRTLGPAGLAAGVLAGYVWSDGEWKKEKSVIPDGASVSCGNYAFENCFMSCSASHGCSVSLNGARIVTGYWKDSSCSCGWKAMYGFEYGETPSPVLEPVTDQDIENDLSKDFANDLSKAVQQATHLLNAASQGFMDSLFDAADPISETSGPTSLPSSTTTTSTTGLDGTTTTTTTTTPKLNYEGGVVTVTVEQQTTTQKPDGSTTTTTTTTTSDDSSNNGSDDPPPVTVDLSEIDICAKNPDIPACKDFCLSNPDVPACKDFCDSHPEAPNCRPLGDLSEPEMPEQDIPLEWSSEKSASGTCPAPISLSYLGQSFYFSWDYVCQFAGGIRPLVILMSVLGSGIWIFGVFRG